MTFLERVRQSSSLYPITQLYIVAVAVVIAAVQGFIGITSAIVILALAAVLAILVAGWFELKQIHKLVDGQRTELVARIDALTMLLDQHGVDAPPEDAKVKSARAGAAQVDGDVT